MVPDGSINNSKGITIRYINTGRQLRVDPHTLDQMVGVLKSIMDRQKALDKQQHSLGDGLSRKLAPLVGLEKWMTAMENTQMDLVKQQEKTRRLLMTIFFTGIVPLLVFITALVLKVWILTLCLRRMMTEGDGKEGRDKAEKSILYI